MQSLLFPKGDVLEFCSGLPSETEVRLVGDHGVYLLAFHPQTKSRKLAFAIGCDPGKDDDYYDNKVDLFGGDDGADRIGTAKALCETATQARAHLVIKLEPTTITVTHD
jgi:hypothetical protein